MTPESAADRVLYSLDSTDGDIIQPLYTPGVNDGAMVRTSEIGGHFTKYQLMGQAFVGIHPNGKEFTQDDLNLFVAYSQFSDQVKDFDALAAGVRYFNPFSKDGFSSDMRLLQESLHSLNSLGADFNMDRTLALVSANRDLIPLAGMASHAFEDARPHEGHGSILGHAGESIMGRSPDHMSPALAAKTAPDTIRFFEAMLGVSADTVLPGQTSSIRDRAMSNLNFALDAAGANGATGADFERQFNFSARDLLPKEALTPPTLPVPSISYLWANTPERALAQTTEYLRSINLNVNPAKFLMDAVDSYTLIANKYLELTNGRLSTGEWVAPIDRSRVFPSPVPVRPLVPQPYGGT